MNQLIMKGSLLIDGTGRPPVEKGMIKIDGDRIAAVGPEKEVGMTAGIPVIDCGDQVLIPGLIDCHCHVSMDPTQENWPSTHTPMRQNLPPT